MCKKLGFGVLVKEPQNAAPCVSSSERDKENGAPCEKMVGKDHRTSSRSPVCVSVTSGCCNNVPRLAA